MNFQAKKLVKSEETSQNNSKKENSKKEVE